VGCRKIVPDSGADAVKLAQPLCGADAVKLAQLI
jgi:hypothetical protein